MNFILESAIKAIASHFIPKLKGKSDKIEKSIVEMMDKIELPENQQLACVAFRDNQARICLSFVTISDIESLYQVKIFDNNYSDAIALKPLLLKAIAMFEQNPESFFSLLDEKKDKSKIEKLFNFSIRKQIQDDGKI